MSPSTNDLSKHYEPDQDRSETRAAHSEDAFDKAMGHKPSERELEAEVERVVSKHPPEVGKGGLSDDND